MNKNDYKILEEAYGNILLKEFDNGETETPEEMEHEKIGMLKNHLRSVIDHATELLDKVENGEVANVPPWAEEKIAIARNLLTQKIDINTISIATGLSEEEIKNLEAKMKS